MPTFRERVANFLLKPELEAMETLRERFMEAYTSGPFVLPPEELIRQLGEQLGWDYGGSTVVYDLVNQLQWEALGRYGGDLESDRRRQVERARLAWRYDVQSRRATEMWTDFGLSQRVQVTPRDDALKPIWDEFWTARRNRPILGAREIANKLSNKLLVDGELFLTFFWSPTDGQATVRRLLTDQVGEIVTDPADRDIALYYVRDMTGQKVTLPNGRELRNVTKLYYPDWQATEAQLKRVEVPSGAKRIDELTPGQTGTRTVALHMALNEDDNGRGWPQFFLVADYAKAYRELIQDWAAVAKGNAMFVRRLTTGGGTRAVDAIRGRFASALSSSNAVETNPPTAAAGTFVHNRAMDMADVPLNRGAGDARETSMLMLGQVSTASGSIPVHWLGRPDMLQNRATARETSRPFEEAMERYQTFLTDVFTDMVEIVAMVSEGAGRGPFEDKGADVNLESPVYYDPSELAGTMAAVTNAFLSGSMDAEVAANALEKLLSISMTMYGVHDPESVLRPEEGAAPEPEEREIEGLGAWAVDLARSLRENRDNGSVTNEEIAEIAVATMLDLAGEGNGRN